MNQFRPAIKRNGHSIGWLTSGDKIYLAAELVPVDGLAEFFPPDLIITLGNVDDAYYAVELTPELATSLKDLADDLIALVFNIPIERQLELMLERIAK